MKQIIMSKYSCTVDQNTQSGGSEIVPITEEYARKWGEKYMDVDEYIEQFGQVDE